MATLQVEPPARSGAADFDADIERVPSAGMREALEDVRLHRNIHGPYATVKEAMRAMLED